MTKERFIQELRSVIDSRMFSYSYKLARYMNNRFIDLSQPNDIMFNNVGFDLKVDSDLMSTPSLNIIKSVVDALVSKLASNKVRPYFTPINGNYKTKQIVRETQKFFDSFFDDQDLHFRILEAFKCSCIFDVGYIWINPITKNIETLPTWSVGLLNSEQIYGDQTAKRMLVKYSSYPGYLVNNNNRWVDYEIYIDLDDQKCYELVNRRIIKTHDYKVSRLPFVTLYYNKPVFGDKSISIVDELDGIQTNIDLISAKISASAQLTPANLAFIYTGQGIEASEISNKEGVIYEVPTDSSGGVSGNPVSIMTPAPFDSQWQSMLEYYVNKAYEITGISALSAQSKKPSGLDSGTALQTMEDIESDRFETQVTNYIQAYTDLTKLVIDVFDGEKYISNKTGLKWKDVQKEKEMYNVQYSASSALSKDPAEKVKQILQMSQVGLVPPSKIGRFMDMPDLEDAYSGAEAVANAVDKCIEMAIEHDIIDIPQFISYQMLSTEIAERQNILFASLTGNDSKDKEIILSLDRLKKLDDFLLEIMEDEGFINNEEDLQITETMAGSSEALAKGSIETLKEPDNDVSNQTMDYQEQ